ncbi:MAG: O-antigen ligase family protein [Bacteroidales bacterium]|nr:O-antigen ligase family protein [Bacteroidales bacterium]
MNTIRVFNLTLSEINARIYFAGLALMVISLPLSRFGMSVAQFIILGSWLLEGGFKKKWQSLTSSLPALVLVFFFLIHVAGLIHTSDFDYGFKDIRTKLPLLLLPVVFVSAERLSEKKTIWLWWLYLGAVLTGTMVTAGMILVKDIIDPREAFPFISHIRYSLHVCFAFFVAAWLMKRKVQLFSFSGIVPALLMAWFTAFLIITSSLTGFTIMVTLLFLIAVIRTMKTGEIFSRIALLLALTVALVFSGFYLHDMVKAYRTPYLNKQTIPDAYTANGNPYSHDTLGHPVENGSYTGMYVCETELREAWNKRSNLDYDGGDKKGQKLSNTLIRYLNSKNLRKDTEGISRLDSSDIQAIEEGTANAVYLKKFSFKSRLYQALYEYDAYRRGENPGGHTVMQRVEFWKTASMIIERNFWWGVGTGDVQQAFDEQYETMNTRLEKQFRWRAHNQYLAVFVAFGISGLIYFLFSLLFPGIALKKSRTFLYPVFLAIMMLSMLTEDTLETQAGASLFAFFNAWLLFGQDMGEKTEAG